MQTADVHATLDPTDDDDAAGRTADSTADDSDADAGNWLHRTPTTDPHSPFSFFLLNFYQTQVSWSDLCVWFVSNKQTYVFET